MPTHTTLKVTVIAAALALGPAGVPCLCRAVRGISMPVAPL